MNQVLGRAQEYSFNQPLSFRSMNYTVRNIVNSSKITLLRKEGKHVLDGMSRFSGTMQNWWTWVTENIVSCLSRLFHCSSPHHHHFTVWASLISFPQFLMWALDCNPVWAHSHHKHNLNWSYQSEIQDFCLVGRKSLYLSLSFRTFMRKIAVPAAVGSHLATTCEIKLKTKPTPQTKGRAKRWRSSGHFWARSNQSWRLPYLQSSQFC